MSGIKKLYLVDDDPDDRFLMASALKEVQADIIIIEAWDGVDLLELLKNNSQTLPDLVLLDVNMPRLTGLEALDRLRSMPTMPEVQIVMYSTSDDPSLIDRANKLGVTDFFKKPSSFADFTAFAEKLATYL